MNLKTDFALFTLVLLNFVINDLSFTASRENSNPKCFLVREALKLLKNFGSLFVGLTHQNFGGLAIVKEEAHNIVTVLFVNEGYLIVFRGGVRNFNHVNGGENCFLVLAVKYILARNMDFKTAVLSSLGAAYVSDFASVEFASRARLCDCEKMTNTQFGTLFVGTTRRVFNLILGHQCSVKVHVGLAGSDCSCFIL